MAVHRACREHVATVELDERHGQCDRVRQFDRSRAPALLQAESEDVRTCDNPDVVETIEEMYSLHAIVDYVVPYGYAWQLLLPSRIVPASHLRDLLLRMLFPL